MSVQQIVDLKSSKVITASMSVTVSDASHALASDDVGTIILTDSDGGLAGIVSERDIVRALSAHGNSAGERPVSDFMSANVITCAPDTEIDDVLTIMSCNSIRHLPVLDDGECVGMISIRDVLDFQRNCLIEDLERRKREANTLQRSHDTMEIAVKDRTRELENEITQRKQVEIALRDSESRIRAFFDHSPSIMYLKNRNHQLELVNAQYLEFHDTSEEDVIGNRGGSKLGHVKRAMMEEFDRKVMETGQPTNDTMPQISAKGEKRIFIVTKFPIYGADGKIQGIGGINTDVTDLHDREEKLSHAKAKAERAAEISEIAAQEAQAANRSKSEFLANMSHEIRTPMNGVLGMTTVLSHTELTATQRESVDTIKESGETLLELLDDILDLSKIEAGRIDLEAVEFSLTKLLSSIERLWRARAQSKGLQFNIHNHAPGTDALRADSTRIRQILANLLSNAIKFTAQGQIELDVSEQPRNDSKVELRFEIRDTGIGIDTDKVPRLFQPFSQADSSTTRQYGGTGLGLSISKQLAELLGGSIGVECTPGVGSTFWFTIVVEHGDPAAIARDNTEKQELPSLVDKLTRPLKILVAEDNLVNQKVITSMLKVIDCQVDVVANGAEAVAAVVRNTYDLILMDVQMPEMDGPTATKRIRSLEHPTATIPIVALTANAMRGDREQYLAAGMTDYLPKPINQHDLLNTIAKIADLGLPELPAHNTRQADNSGVEKQPLNDEAVTEVNNMIEEIDDFLDGTGK